jgi:hypothetical protein
MAQSTPIHLHARRTPCPEAARIYRVRRDGPGLLDALARNPRVTVLADFRDTTGCLIIGCPFAGRAGNDHRCAVMGPAAERPARIACIHPDCWHLTTEDFLERLGPDRSAPLEADPRFDAARRERQLQVILAVLNHPMPPLDGPEQSSAAAGRRHRGRDTNSLDSSAR